MIGTTLSHYRIVSQIAAGDADLCQQMATRKDVSPLVFQHVNDGAIDLASAYVHDLDSIPV